jgi:hypothetical protein
MTRAILIAERENQMSKEIQNATQKVPLIVFRFLRISLDIC